MVSFATGLEPDRSPLPRPAARAASAALEHEVARLKQRWFRAIVTIAAHKPRCNPIERRRLSRWSSAIEILERRLQRDLEIECAVRDAHADADGGPGR
jgi:DnaJ-domain-containing protein 1